VVFRRSLLDLLVYFVSMEYLFTDHEDANFIYLCSIEDKLGVHRYITDELKNITGGKQYVDK
jgi:hypothetical protein